MGQDGLHSAYRGNLSGALRPMAAAGARRALWPNLGDGYCSGGAIFFGVTGCDTIGKLYAFDEPRQLICAV